jgi:hypothetical protein
VVSCSNDLKGDSEFFSQLYKHIEDPHFLKSVYNYLTSLEGLDTFHSEAKPVSAYEKVLVSCDSNPIADWLLFYAESKLPDCISVADAHEEFTDWCRGEKVTRYPLTSVTFSRELLLFTSNKNYWPNGSPLERKKSGSIRSYRFDKAAILKKG